MGTFTIAATLRGGTLTLVTVEAERVPSASALRSILPGYVTGEVIARTDERAPRCACPIHRTA